LRNKNDGTYFFPTEHAAAKETVARRLEIHPQLAEAILAINQCFLAEAAERL